MNAKVVWGCVVALVGLLAGCINTIRFPPDMWTTTWETGDSGIRDTSVPDGPGVQVQEVRSGCDETGTTWTWSARNDGWSGEARIAVFRTSDGQVEEHGMRLTASDPEGKWEKVEVGPLLDGTPVADQIPEVSSRFDCEADADTLSFVIRIWDANQNLMDCVVWGADLPGATAGVRSLDPDVLGLGGCREVAIQ